MSGELDNILFVVYLQDTGLLINQRALTRVDMGGNAAYALQLRMNGRDRE